MVTGVPVDVTEVTVASTGGGSGGGGLSTRTALVQKETDNIFPIDIIVPGPIVIYFNRTMKVPITIKNKLNKTIKGISLQAYTNADNVTFEFVNDYFSELEAKHQVTTNLYVTNYRGSGPYEIWISANVSDPEFNDTATIFVNSLEQTEEGDLINTKIAFARDLLSNNPECQELFEVLDKAILELHQNDFNETAKILDSVIDGCKYLVSQARAKQQPHKFTQIVAAWSFISSNLFFIIVSLLTAAIALALYLTRKRPKH
jgi:hypothetical protein